jgi:hypothetical protein
MRIICCCSLALVCIVLAGRAAQAQAQPAGQGQPAAVQPQDRPAQPVSPERSSMAGAIPNAVQDTNVAGALTLNADTRSLAGAQLLSLGAPQTEHTVWTPYLSISETYDTNSVASNQFVPHGSSTWSAASGGVHIRHITGASDFSLRYDGSGWIANNLGANPTVEQNLSIAATRHWRRYTVTLIDQVGYSPESYFGYGVGMNAVSSFGTNGAIATTALGLQPGFLVDQSILTSYGKRITNTAVAELDRHLTPLTTLTIVGSYGLLHYFENNLVNDNNFILQAGYNHQFDRKNTIAFFYRFGGYRFKNFNQSINDHSVQFSYARRITGRLTFQFFGGPDLALSRTPLSTCAAGCIGIGSSNTRDLFWSLTSTLHYQLRQTGFDLTYNHGIDSGSGVLLGGVANNFSGSVSRQFTRSLNVGWLTGYSRNSGYAAPTTSGATSSGQQTYDYAFTGLNLHRRLGASVGIDLTYEAQYQRSNTVFCVVSPCGTTFLDHQVSLGFSWMPRSKPL